MKKESFEQLYHQYYRLLLQVAGSILPDEEDRKDAVQETFLRAFNNLENISEIICPKTRNYLVIICRRCSLDILKQRQRKNNRETAVLDEFLASVPDAKNYGDPESSTAANDVLHRIAACLLELPEHYQSCLYLELVEEHTYPEIAGELGMKPETVRKRLQRGKKLLQKKMRERGVLE